MNVPALNTKNMFTVDGSNEELSNEMQTHHLDIARMPKDKEGEGTRSDVKPQVTKRESGNISKQVDSRASKHSNNDIKAVIGESKINKAALQVATNQQKHLVNKSINA